MAVTYEATGDARVVLVVCVGGAMLALDAHRVVDVLGRVDVTFLGGGPRGLAGVIPWRARAVAVVDLGALVGEASLDAPRARTVIVQVGDDAVAFPVDAVREPREIAATEPAHTTSA